MVCTEEYATEASTACTYAFLIQYRNIRLGSDRKCSRMSLKRKKLIKTWVR